MSRYIHRIVLLLLSFEYLFLSINQCTYTTYTILSILCTLASLQHLVTLLKHMIKHTVNMNFHFYKLF